MKKLLFAVLVTAFCAACEQKIETPASGPDKVEKNTTIINPPATEKKESHTTIVNPPAAETKTEKSTTTTTETK
ncbi:MAG: hypothetical protein QOE70_4909 [Chthoniobacter sp.]|nr:hypothetical protein [Chthoniobacter sp.]